MTSTPHTHNWFIFVTPNGPWTLDIEPFYVYCHGLHFQYLSLSSLCEGNSFCTIQILKVRSEPNIFLLLCHHHILPKSLLLLCTNFWFLSNSDTGLNAADMTIQFMSTDLVLVLVCLCPAPDQLNSVPLYPLLSPVSVYKIFI